MASDDRTDQSAQKLRSLNTIVSGDGRETVIVLDVVDNATREPQPPIRCVTDQQGLSLMIAKFMQSAKIARDKLEAAGAAAPQAARRIHALHFRTGLVGLSSDKNTVTLEIQTSRARRSPSPSTRPRPATSPSISSRCRARRRPRRSSTRPQ